MFLSKMHIHNYSPVISLHRNISIAPSIYAAVALTPVPEPTYHLFRICIEQEPAP